MARVQALRPSSADDLRPLAGSWIWSRKDASIAGGGFIHCATVLAQAPKGQTPASIFPLDELAQAQHSPFALFNFCEGFEPILCEDSIYVKIPFLFFNEQAKFK